MKESFVAIGSLGSIVAALAAAAPCCLPLLASVAGAVGISILFPYSEYTEYMVQAFGLLAVTGTAWSFRAHRKLGPLAVATASAIGLIVVYNLSLIAWLLYSALAGLVVAVIWNHHEIKRCNQCQAAT